MAERTRSRPPSKVNGFSQEPVSPPGRPYVAPAVPESTTAPPRASEGPPGLREATFEDIVWGGHQYGAQVSLEDAPVSPPQEWWDEQEQQHRSGRHGDEPYDDIESLMEEYDAVKDPKSWLAVLLMIIMFLCLGFGVYLVILAFGGDDILGIGEPILKILKGGIGPKSPKIGF